MYLKNIRCNKFKKNVQPQLMKKYNQNERDCLNSGEQ